MIDRFTDMPMRNLTVDWDTDMGPLDMRYHSAGIGGVHSMPAPRTVVDAMAELKPGLIRIFLQEFFYVYPDHGIFDWAKMDAYMDAAHAMGGDIMASICIKPRVLYPAIDESVWAPNDAGEWQSLIGAMALRYSVEKPYVTHWAIANEMNIGEWGGCPYLIKNPDDFFEYYKLTAEPIRTAAPGVKVGGPSHAGGGKDAGEYLSRFLQLCKDGGVAVDFVCYNEYSDSPERHAADGRAVRDALDAVDPGVKLYMTEFNVGIGEELSLEEKPYEPKYAASLAASILALHEDGCLDGSFQYHIYDQYNDPREFAPWFARARYMAEHWNDKAHRLGLLDLDGKAKPQYYLYQLLYSLAGRRVGLSGADINVVGAGSGAGAGIGTSADADAGADTDADAGADAVADASADTGADAGADAVADASADTGADADDGVLRGIATRAGSDRLSVFLVNFAERGARDAVSHISFANAPAGIYRLNVYRIDAESSAAMKAGELRSAGTGHELPPAESRLVYAHPDFHFDVFTPANSVTLIQLDRQMQ